MCIRDRCKGWAERKYRKDMCLTGLRHIKTVHIDGKSLVAVSEVEKSARWGEISLDGHKVQELKRAQGDDMVKNCSTVI